MVVDKVNSFIQNDTQLFEIDLKVGTMLVSLSRIYKEEG